jgi:hypothetical protein
LGNALLAQGMYSAEAHSNIDALTIQQARTIEQHYESSEREKSEYFFMHSSNALHKLAL